MKKFIIIIAFVIVMLALMVFMTACKDSTEPIIEVPNNNIVEPCENHTFGNWIWVNDNGAYNERICTVCNHTERVAVTGGLEYRDDIVIGKGSATTTDIILPHVSPEGIPITGINSDLGYKYPEMSSIFIPEGVTSIAPKTFSLYQTLASITVAENNPNYQSLEGNLYSKDGEVLIQHSPGEAISFAVPSGVTTIGSYAFNSQILTAISVPEGVITIEDGAFCLSLSLTSIEIAAANPSYKSINGNLYTKSGDTIIQYTAGKTATSFVIPDDVTAIASRAFVGCENIISLTIPEGVTTIEDSAFMLCKGLTAIVIPQSVTYIAKCAFLVCQNLDSVTFLDSQGWYKTTVKGATSGLPWTPNNDTSVAAELKNFENHWHYYKQA